MNEVYCYDHHLLRHYQETINNTLNDVTREEEEEDIQTIQSDAMMSLATAPPNPPPNPPPVHLLEEIAESKSNHTSSTGSSILNHSSPNDGSMKQWSQPEVATQPISPTTTSTTSTTLSLPLRTLVDTDDDIVPSIPFSSSQSLLYHHTLAATMAVIMTKDNAKNLNHHNRNDPPYDGGSELQRQIYDVDDDSNRTGNSPKIGRAHV